MLRPHRFKAFVPFAILLTVVASASSTCGGGITIMAEDFSTAPALNTKVSVVADNAAARFVYDAVGEFLTARYDTALPTAKMLWDLGMHLDQNSTFGFRIGFQIESLATTDLGQIAFGLLNSVTTGNDRPGGEGPSADFANPGSDVNDAHDIVTIDYFPFDKSSDPVFPFNSRSYTPTLITSDDGDDSTSFYDQIFFTASQETLIDDLGEPQNLSVGTKYETELIYSGNDRQATLRLRDASGYLSINAVGVDNPPGNGGPDADITTIQVPLNPGQAFSVNAFGLLLWEDTYGFGASTVTADVVFDGFEVFVVPEPTALAAVATLLVPAILRRSPRQTSRPSS